MAGLREASTLLPQNPPPEGNGSQSVPQGTPECEGTSLSMKQPRVFVPHAPGPSSCPPPLAHWRWPAASISTSHHTRAPRTPSIIMLCIWLTGVCMANLGPAACTPQHPQPSHANALHAENKFLLLPGVPVSSMAETWPGRG